MNKIDKVFHVLDLQADADLQNCSIASDTVGTGSGAAAGQTVGPSLHWWALPTRTPDGC